MLSYERRRTKDDGRSEDYFHSRIGRKKVHLDNAGVEIIRSSSIEVAANNFPPPHCLGQPFYSNAGVESYLRNVGMNTGRSSIVTCILLSVLLAWSASAREEWQIIKSEHFIVYYLDDKDFAGDVSNSAERYYNKIANDLGYSRYDKFWQWENRAKIYIYRTHEQFIAEKQVPRKWAQGMVKYKEKEITSYRWNKGFLDELLPHELTHLIFRDFVGYPASGGGIPLWLDEGIAQWEEETKKKEAEGIVRALIKEGAYIPVDKLTAMDVREEDDYVLARNFYAEAITLVGFLINEYGGRRFTQLSRELRDGKSLNEALSFVYGSSIKGVSELEKKWVKYYGG